MYSIIFRNRVIAKTLLESGDPSLFSVSGELIEAGDSAAMARWIIELGGEQDQGVYLFNLDNRFLVVQGQHTPVPFTEGSIICVPEEDEIFIELVGIPGEEYSHFFSGHIEKLHLSTAAAVI